MKTISVSETKITLIKPSNGHIGFASVLVNESIFIGSIAIYSTPEGRIRLVYPNKKIKDVSQAICHPINKEAAKVIETEILARLAEYRIKLEGAS